MRAMIKAISCVPIAFMLTVGPQAFAQSTTTADSTSSKSSGPASMLQALGNGGGMAGMATHPLVNPAIRAFLAAERLTTLHTFLEITPDQEDAWHKFSSAVMDMASTAPNIMALGATDDVFETMDNLSTGAKVLAEKVGHARDILQGLKSVLRPEQTKRANEAFVALRSMLISQISSGASASSAETFK